ncbi:hypothetical protein [Nocardia wallacei]|uniref:hypothetical protein n=1 Tax=Nocardia wallacei TaxID=480035 RepID=UPI0024562EBD|nr:hypothetical protein [Nocardia wallacei]
MGTSYIDFRGGGFWCRDESAELWLHLLSAEIDADPDRPAWLAEAGAEWRRQASVTGSVRPALDKYLGSDPGRVATVVELSERVRDRLHGWTPAIPQEVVNGWGTGGGAARYCRNVDTVWLLRFAEVFVRLLRGELTADPDPTTVY